MNELNETNEHIETGSENKRPQLFAILLIMSMINGAASSFSNLVLYSLVDSFREIFQDSDKMNFMGMEMDISLFLNTDKRFFLFQGLLYAVSFTGALLMWKFNRAGFHLYVISQILLLIVATIFLPELPFPYLDVAVTALFIYVYAKSLNLMHS